MSVTVNGVPCLSLVGGGGGEGVQPPKKKKLNFVNKTENFYQKIIILIFTGTWRSMFCNVPNTPSLLKKKK